MKRVSVLGLVTALVISMPLAASALTFKKGQVLGSDGQIYDGASPDLRDRLIKKAQRTGESAGVTAGKLFVVVNDTITFVPLSDLAGKSEETVKEIVVEKVTETVTKVFTEQALAKAGINVEDLADGAEDAASDEEVAAALASIDDADVAGIAAAEAAKATKEAWANISQEDLAEATQYAAEFAAEEAAKVIEHQNIENQLQDLIDSGASEAEIDQYIADNPAPE
tara:strand:- start:671 stop:1345 length:675 start_codon:yes stop_codon:yes gene_type:complete